MDEDSTFVVARGELLLRFSRTMPLEARLGQTTPLRFMGQSRPALERFVKRAEVAVRRGNVTRNAF